ncbi:MAG: hypothetical protein KF768_03065 [Phycisphaeraceae bacterium]|nr:hypothetical protein [Phycisphaeraceae bacterium]
MPPHRGFERSVLFLTRRFDGNANSNYTNGGGEFDDDREFNAANELLGRNWDGTMGFERTPVYDDVGNLTHDDTNNSGDGLRYRYDVMGRLLKIETNESSPTILAQFEYDANHQRISWTHPERNGGSPGLQATRHEAIYDHRWRMIEVRRDETLGGLNTGDDESEQGRFERFYYHNAGVAGSGGSVYIDSVIARDRSIAIKPTVLNERTYYAQNWRGDVVQLIRPGGARAEANRYSAYGRPYNILEADVNADGVVDLADLLDFLDDWNTHFPSAAYVGLADYNFDGAVDLSDLLSFQEYWNPDLGVATGRDVLTAGETRLHGGNRKGYAGYEHEPWWYEFPLSGTPPTGVPNAEAGPLMQLARHRFYRADLGTWTRRDPLGYVDGMGLYVYTVGNPLIKRDPLGMMSQSTDPWLEKIPEDPQQAVRCCESLKRDSTFGSKVWGATTCCYGKPVICIFDKNIDRQYADEEFRKIFKSCVMQHEIQHYHDLIEQNRCGPIVPRNDPGFQHPFDMKDPKDRRDFHCSECRAYQQSYWCLQAQKHRCGQWPADKRHTGKRTQCQKNYDDAMDEVIKKRLEHCGACTPVPIRPGDASPLPHWDPIMPSRERVCDRGL